MDCWYFDLLLFIFIIILFLYEQSWSSWPTCFIVLTSLSLFPNIIIRTKLRIFRKKLELCPNLKISLKTTIKSIVCVLLYTLVYYCIELLVSTQVNKNVKQIKHIKINISPLKKKNYSIFYMENNKTMYLGNIICIF